MTLREKRYCIFMAEKILKENFSHRGWKDEYSFVRHKFFAEKIKLIDKLVGEELVK